MPLGWFLIPAVTGYWFLTHLHFTRYGALRDSGYHVFFRAIIAGVDRLGRNVKDLVNIVCDLEQRDVETNGLLQPKKPLILSVYSA